MDNLTRIYCHHNLPALTAGDLADSMCNNPNNCFIFAMYLRYVSNLKVCSSTVQALFGFHPLHFPRHHEDFNVHTVRRLSVPRFRWKQTKHVGFFQD